MMRLPRVTAFLLFTIAASCASSRNTSPEEDRWPPKARASIAVDTGTGFDAGAPSPLANGSSGVEAAAGGSVLLVVIDTLNYRHLGAYGYARMTSPNIDDLARRGLSLTGYVSNSSWTRPSYTTIVTGQPKRVHGVELNGHKLSDDVETLAERFADAGYRTASFVGNPLVGANVGYSQGFEVYVDTKAMGRMFPSDEALVDRAIRWLGREDPRPFFLVVFLTAPHAPYRPPEGYRRFLDEVPGGRIIERPQREYRQPLPVPDRDRIVAAYDGEVAFADAQVGRLIDSLDAANALSQTTVLVTADHGEAFGEHNCYTHTYHMWEPVLRVPFVLAAPGIGPKNASDDRPFTHVDIAPTLLDLAGVDYPRDELPGVSVASVLDGSAKVDEERLIFSQYDAHGVRREAVRKGRWKLVHHHAVPRSAAARLNDLSQGAARPSPRDLPSLAWDGERYELYDLDADPEESRDVYEQRVGTDTFRILHMGIESSLQGRAAPVILSEETKAVLAAMGYLRRPTDIGEAASARR